jgi:hypothetical protein
MLFENILSFEELQLLQQAIVYETTNFPCLMVPRYQTYPTMHRKYKFYKFWKTLEAAVLESAKSINGKEYKIQSSWFNSCKVDSNFDWHTHEGFDSTCVFYALNCDDNGTMIKTENEITQSPAKDNSLIFMDIGVEHRVPQWNGVDRYSVAFQLVYK